MNELTDFKNSAKQAMDKSVNSLKAIAYYNDYYYRFDFAWFDFEDDKVEVALEKEKIKKLTISFSGYVDTVVVREKSDSGYWNLCVFDVDRNGQYQVNYEYRPELDEAHEQEIIESIGQELYDKYKEEDQAKSQQNNKQLEPEVESAGEPVYSIPELLGFIREELSADIPSGWAELILKAEVFVEDSKQAVSLVSYYHTGDKQLHRFTPSNSIGPMNAVMKLQLLMQQEGQSWAKATLVFESSGSVAISLEE